MKISFQYNFLIILCTICSIAYGQDTCILKLNLGFSSERIELYPNKTFRYYSYSCTHRIEEYGNYKFDNDELKLIFVDTNNITLESKIVDLKSTENPTNKILLNVRIISAFDSTPLDFVRVRISKKDSIVKTGYTDKKGIAKLAFEELKEPLNIKISYIGHYTIDSTINFENKEYLLTIIMNKKSATKIHKNGDEIIYTIARETNKEIELSKDRKEFYTYKITCH